tara:strand:+ start:155 stop:352 length:198 start_codon:yes stop_codon:yes gene_type:complete
LNIFYDLIIKIVYGGKKMTKKNKDENNDGRKLKLDDETLRRIVNLAIERWFFETNYTDEFKGEFE